MQVAVFIMLTYVLIKPPKGKPLGNNLGYQIAALLLLPILNLITRRNWLGRDKVPQSGAAIFFTNHISYADPLVFAHYLYKNGRAVRFIGKASLWKVPIVGWVIRKAEQIPVARESSSSREALQEAVNALELGHAIGIYPEGTLTRDPDLWPMTAKTGAVRLAIISCAPLIPVAQWGAQKILSPYSKIPRLFPPTKVTVQCGDAIDLSHWHGKENDNEAMSEATMHIMRVITGMLSKIRDENPPEIMFDIRKSDLPRTGNFKKRK